MSGDMHTVPVSGLGGSIGSVQLAWPGAIHLPCPCIRNTTPSSTRRSAAGATTPPSSTGGPTPTQEAGAVLPAGAGDAS